MHYARCSGDLFVFLFFGSGSHQLALSTFTSVRSNYDHSDRQHPTQTAAIWVHQEAQYSKAEASRSEWSNKRGIRSVEGIQIG